MVAASANELARGICGGPDQAFASSSPYRRSQRRTEGQRDDDQSNNKTQKG
jgi:hypothetical protein